MFWLKSEAKMLTTKDLKRAADEDELRRNREADEKEARRTAELPERLLGMMSFLEYEVPRERKGHNYLLLGIKKLEGDTHVLVDLHGGFPHFTAEGFFVCVSGSSRDPEIVSGRVSEAMANVAAHF